MPEIGERKTAFCSASDETVEMVYVGFDENGISLDGTEGRNGNPGGFCLHES